MNAAMLMLAMAASGVVAGRAELPGGGFEYVIQIEPQLLDSQPGGLLASSDIPPGLRGARRYRVIVGEGPLPVGVIAVSDLPAEQLVLAKPLQNPPSLNDAKAEPAEFVQPVDAQVLHVAKSEPSSPKSDVEPETSANSPIDESEDRPADAKPWTALVLTMLGLFVSIGGNVYLGWNFLGLRKRYRAMIGGETKSE
jgi:hypothetical protein